MGIARTILLWGSENHYLRKNVPKLKFVRKALKRFMPGEQIEDAIKAADEFLQNSIPTVFTHLGENLTNLSEAGQVTSHYLDVLDKLHQNKLKTEISLKLTQLGFDLSVDQTYENFKKIAVKTNELMNNILWIDMEGSDYTQKTIDFYKRIKQEVPNVGLCLQAYLYRTEKDVADLLVLSPAIRLVKGAYKEPANIAFEQKSKTDENYYKLSVQLMKGILLNGGRVAFGTHDIDLISKIENAAAEINYPKENLEFQMLYGIKPAEQLRLTKEGYTIRVLISYGEAWYPWYVRRLAERPANVLFVLKNLLAS